MERERRERRERGEREERETSLCVSQNHGDRIDRMEFERRLSWTHPPPIQYVPNRITLERELNLIRKKKVIFMLSRSEPPRRIGRASSGRARRASPARIFSFVVVSVAGARFPSPCRGDGAMECLRCCLCFRFVTLLFPFLSSPIFHSSLFL